MGDRCVFLGNRGADAAPTFGAGLGDAAALDERVTLALSLFIPNSGKQGNRKNARFFSVFGYGLFVAGKWEP